MNKTIISDAMEYISYYYSKQKFVTFYLSLLHNDLTIPRELLLYLWEYMNLSNKDRVAELYRFANIAWDSGNFNGISQMVKNEVVDIIKKNTEYKDPPIRKSTCSCFPRYMTTCCNICHICTPKIKKHICQHGNPCQESLGLLGLTTCKYCNFHLFIDGHCKHGVIVNQHCCICVGGFKELPVTWPSELYKYCDNLCKLCGSNKKVTWNHIFHGYIGFNPTGPVGTSDITIAKKEKKTKRQIQKMKNIHNQKRMKKIKNR